MDVIKKFVIRRLTEPSTWTAGGVGAILIHQYAPGALGDGLVMIGAGAGVVLGALLPERKA